MDVGEKLRWLGAECRSQGHTVASRQNAAEPFDRFAALFLKVVEPSALRLPAVPSAALLERRIENSLPTPRRFLAKDKVPVGRCSPFAWALSNAPAICAASASRALRRHAFAPDLNPKNRSQHVRFFVFPEPGGARGKHLCHSGSVSAASLESMKPSVFCLSAEN